MVMLADLRMVFVHPDLGIGGAERLVLDVAVAMHHEGVKVKFLTNHFNPDHAFQEFRSPHYPVTVIGGWLPGSICGLMRALCAYFRMMFLAFMYLMFYCCCIGTADIFFVDQIPMAVPILKMLRKPIIYYCHHPDLLASPRGGFFKRLYRRPIDWLEQYGISRADYILVNSKYTEQVFRKTFPEIKSELKILYPTIASSFLKDITEAVKQPLEEMFPNAVEPEQPNDIIFVSLNRFHPAKRLELAIEAMASLKAKLSSSEWSRVRMVIAGGYDPKSTANFLYMKKLLELASEKQLLGKITFIRSPSDKFKATLLRSCDCLIYTPSHEHFGIVPLEAMAAEKPVIACNSGGPRETVVHAQTGYLCKARPESMAMFMARCMNKQKNMKMGKRGHRRLMKLFAYTKFNADCMQIVTEVYTKCG